MTAPLNRSVMLVTLLSHCSAGGVPVMVDRVISASCPVCGGARGDPMPVIRYCCGHAYCADVWINPCGHLDTAADILAEAAAGYAAPRCLRLLA